MTTNQTAQVTRSGSWGASFIQFPLVRILLATTLIAVTLNRTFALASFLVPDKSMRIIWPALLATVLSVAIYLLFVRLVEKRPVSEFSRSGALRELGAGLLGGVALVSTVMAILTVAGVYHVSGMNSWTVLVVPIAEMVMIAVLEEIVFRGIVYRIIEKSLGTWTAIVLSSLIFAVVHLPNDGISLLAVISVTVAGVFFAAAYLLTGRLWLPIGIHFAWNFCLGNVFSATVSGHQAQGLLDSHIAGADWLTGGVFGVEASAVTPLVFMLTAIYLIVHSARQNKFVLPFWKTKRVAHA